MLYWYYKKEGRCVTVKRSLFPVLSMLFLTGCAAGAVSSAAVPSTAAPLPGTAETAGAPQPAGTAEAAATPAPTADAVQPPQGLVETGAAVLDYDEIRLIDYFREYQPYPDTDYYTMCRDGKWGLMRSDGTEVLPCRASEPLFECSWNAHHWHGYLDDLFGSPDYEAAYKAASQTLTESGDGRLCAEHDGGGYRQFVCLQDDKTYLYSGSMGPGQFITLTDDILRLFSGSTNGLVPAQSGTTTHESDEWYNFVGDGLYVYRCRNSGAANNFVYTAADCFFDAPLAAAQREGKWVYLDTAGHEVTAPCYDGIYRPNHYTDEPLVFARAAPLLSGYAVVSRNGKFGLLDNTGVELVPCVYDGLVWDGGTAWVRLGDDWHEYSIPGVTKPDPLDDLPESIVAPDTRPTRTDIVFFSVDTAGERLNVRTGPGLEYDILEKLSDSAQVRLYGALSTAPGWALVKYGHKFGWVSQDFLVLGR